MPLKSLYLNHITLMLNYIKYLLKDESDKETPLEINYFIINLEENRRKFYKHCNLEYDESNEIKIEKIIKKELEEDEIMGKGKGSDFIGDRSYNMCDNYNFRQLIHFEYLSLFLTRNKIKK